MDRGEEEEECALGGTNKSLFLPGLIRGRRVCIQRAILPSPTPPPPLPYLALVPLLSSGPVPAGPDLAGSF